MNPYQKYKEIVLEFKERGGGFYEYQIIVRQVMPYAREMGWREGQTYFNVLHDVKPVLANEIRGSMADPFYRESRLPLFLMILKGAW